MPKTRGQASRTKHAESPVAEQGRVPPLKEKRKG